MIFVSIPGPRVVRVSEARPMSRRKLRGRPLDGWLVIDKPAGLTSTDVVNRVRRAFDAQKAGHGGTLDPLATGHIAVGDRRGDEDRPLTLC